MLRAIAILLVVVTPAVVCAQNSEQAKKKIKKAATFKIIRLGNPVAYFGNYCGTSEISKAELLKIDTLKIKYCFNLPSEYVVTKYKFSATVGGQHYVIVVKDCRITSEIKNVLFQATSDTKIKFSGIIAERKETEKTSFDDIVIKVAERKDTSLITYKLQNKIPEPDLFSIQKQLPQKVSRLELMFVDQLLVKCDCKIPSFSTQFSVVAFELKTIVDGNKRIFSADGSNLTGEMRQALQMAKTGTKFHLEKIKVKTNDGVVGYLSPRSFRVINP
jgi:hypothetical protein